MHIRSRALSWLLFILVASVLLAATLGVGPAPTPARPAAPAHQATPARPPAEPGSYTPNTPVPTDRDVAATQSQLIKLLRLSPTLTTVVSRDPSLLSNQEYVAHNNPQLAEFLANHPEVARNPEFYLFTHMHPDGGGPDESLQREVWPDVYRAPQQRSAFSEFASDLPPLLAFACFLVALIWMTRVFVENRRWGRIFKLQSEVHGRLIDKFTSNQELALYMETEAGKRFLEAAPIPVGFETSQRVPNAVARVLTPLQIGIVLVLLGIGLLGIRRADHEMEIPLLVMGTLVLMPGVGFIISAGITWLLAARLGLMPEHPAANTNEPPFISPNRQ